MAQETIYHSWPISFSWAWKYKAWRTWFTWHAVEVSCPHAYWVYHLGPLKIVLGRKKAMQFQYHFERALNIGLSVDGFTRDWMRKERGIGIGSEYH